MIPWIEGKEYIKDYGPVKATVTFEYGEKTIDELADGVIKPYIDKIYKPNL